MATKPSEGRVLELAKSSKEQRQAISRVASAIRATKGMSFDDVYIAAHGSREGQKDEDERNFQKGTLAHKKIARIYRWIIDNYLPLGCEIAPEVFDPSLLTRWTDFVRANAIYGHLQHRIVSGIGLTERSNRQPIAETPIRVNDSFYFELMSNLNGMALTLEQADGVVYPFSLHDNAVSVTVPVKSEKQFLPRLPGTNEPDLLSDQINQGLRCYYMLITAPDVIGNCKKGLIQRQKVQPEKLDQIALAFKDAAPGSFELHRLNVVFTSRTSQDLAVG